MGKENGKAQGNANWKENKRLRARNFNADRSQVTIQW